VVRKTLKLSLFSVYVDIDKLTFNNRILKHFINGSLGVSPESHNVSGFELVPFLFETAACNTYIETVSNKADTLYLRVKESLTEMTTYSYLDYMKRLSSKFEWKNKEFVLAFDYTDEEFYGEVQGFYIHGWTGKQGITGKFKFLTCSIVASTAGQRVPLLSIPIMLGHSMSKEILYCLSLLKPLLSTVDLVLFDRSFYSKALMDELTRANVPYLIFIPKNEQIKAELEAMGKKEQKLMVHEFAYKNNKTTNKGQTYQVFLKGIYSKKLDQELDWAFATNVEDIGLDSIIKTYKQRWNIETGFRVQDEALIKCKSTDMTIRYFLFVYEQLLQMIWGCFYQSEVSFKRFLIELSKTCTELVAKAPSASPRVAAKPND